MVLGLLEPAELAGGQSGSLKCLDGQDIQRPHEKRIKEDPFRGLLGILTPSGTFLGYGILSLGMRELRKDSAVLPALWRQSLPKLMFWGQFFHQSTSGVIADWLN